MIRTTKNANSVDGNIPKMKDQARPENTESKIIAQQPSRLPTFFSAVRHPLVVIRCTSFFSSSASLLDIFSMANPARQAPSTESVKAHRQ